MKITNIYTRILAIVGVILVWFPILAPVLSTLITFGEMQVFRMDYLMPAELFPFALVGGLLLVWAALRAHSRLGIVAWSLGGSVGILIAGQILAMLTGLATGEEEPVGWRWMLVLSSLGIYSLMIMMMGVGGVLLVRDLFVQTRSTPKNKTRPKA